MRTQTIHQALATAAVMTAVSGPAHAQALPNYLQGVPDWSQPLYPDDIDWISGFFPTSTPIHPLYAYCTPTSAANIVGYHRDHAAVPPGSPPIGDGKVFPDHYDWAAGSPPGYRDEMATFGGIPSLGFALNTNALRFGGVGSHTGTRLIDLGSGLSIYFSMRQLNDVYIRNYGARDPLMVPSIFSSYDSTWNAQVAHDDANGLAEIIREIDAGRPLLGHFAHAIFLSAPELPDDLDYFPDAASYKALEWDPNVDPSSGPISDPDDVSGGIWDIEAGLAHTMTIVGYWPSTHADNPFTPPVDAVIVFDNREDPQLGPHQRLPLVLPWNGSPWMGLTVFSPDPTAYDCVQSHSEATILYVDDDAAGDGSSWTSAYGDLQDALTAAAMVSGPVEVWVAAGTYRPSILTDPTDPRTATFVLPDFVRVYGGFAPGATSLADRDVVRNVTILSGDLNDDDASGNLGDNAIHVVTADATGRQARLDGFTIMAGRANQSTSGRDRGGAMFIRAANPIVSHCRFPGNRAKVGGAIACLLDSTPTFVNCSFTGNYASVDGGAILCGNSSAPVLINCTLAYNTTDGDGGGFYLVNGGTPSILNSILWNNEDVVGMGEWSQIYNHSGSVTINYSCVSSWSGGFGGAGNTGADPMLCNVPGADGLVGTLDDNPRLKPGSNAIDAGTNVVEVSCMDLSGRSRVVAVNQNPATVDLGAYESQGSSPCAADLDGDCTVDTFDFLLLLSAWGPNPGDPADLNGDGFVDTLDFLDLLAAWGFCP